MSSFIFPVIFLLFFSHLEVSLADSYSGDPIVFIHGVKGSRLRQKNGSCNWLTIWQAMGILSPNLALPTEINGGVQERDDLVAHDVLDAVGPKPIYGPFLSKAAQFGVPFHTFIYDWRRDNNETEEAFVQFLANLHGGRPVRVIAHSMGGLLTLAAMNARPELFSQVVFVGVPFAGGIGFLPDLHSGRSTGLNSKILSSKVVGTFPSFLSLFPTESDRLVDVDGKIIPVNFYDPNDWQRLKIGPFSDAPPSPKYKSFFEGSMALAKKFREKLVTANIVYPPLLVIAGIGKLTLSRALLNGPKSELGWDFESAKLENGDGRVALQHSQPPSGIPHSFMTVTGEHTEILSAQESLAAMRKFLKLAPVMPQ